MTEAVPTLFGEEFLTWPDLFPARSAGELWGENRILLDIVGGPIGIEGLSEDQCQRLEDRFAPLTIAVGSIVPAARLRCFRAPRTDFRQLDVTGWSLRLDLDFEPSSVRLAGWECFGRLDWDPSLLAALWTPSDGFGTFLGSVENMLRVIVAYRALECGGALLHSAGIEADGSAYLFFGPSGAGKSTLSRLSLDAGMQVLSDELNVILSSDQRTVVDRVPFAGDFGQSAQSRVDYPLAAIFSLRQGSTPSKEATPRARGVAALAASAPFVNADPYRGARLLENLERLTANIPVEILTFDLDPSFWSLVRCP